MKLVFVVAFIFTLIGTIESLFIGYDVLTHGSLSALRAPDLGRGIRSWTEHHAMRPGFSDSAVKLNSFGLRSPTGQSASCCSATRLHLGSRLRRRMYSPAASKRVFAPGDIRPSKS
jgi:hypothetical protein